VPNETFAQEVEEVRERTRSAFATYYFTLLSIIQGVALAALFAKVDSLIQRHGYHTPQLIMTLGIFLWIVGTWHQYQMGLMLYSWTAQLFDSFTPFTLGVFEFAAIIGMDHGVSIVLLANGLFFIPGLAAFEYQYSQARRSASTVAFTDQLNAGFRAVDGMSCVMSAVISLSAAALTWRLDPASGYQAAGASVVVILAIGHLAREAIEWSIVQRRLAEMAP